jgi:hypothetical protein
MFAYRWGKRSGADEWGVSDSDVGAIFCGFLIGGRRVGLLVCGDGGWGLDVVLFVVGVRWDREVFPSFMSLAASLCCV